MSPVIERLAIETMDDHSVEKVVCCFWLKWHCLSLAIHPITGRLVNDYFDRGELGFDGKALIRYWVKADQAAEMQQKMQRHGVAVGGTSAHVDGKMLMALSQRGVEAVL